MWLHRADGVEAGGYKKPGEWWWESFSGGVKVQRTDEMEPRAQPDAWLWRPVGWGQPEGPEC